MFSREKKNNGLGSLINTSLLLGFNSFIEPGVMFVVEILFSCVLWQQYDNFMFLNSVFDNTYDDNFPK